MGRSGNQPGFKVFSISTTIRNPKRNAEFLEVLKKFDNKELTVDVKDAIYFELVKNGIYRFTNLDNLIKEKYKAGIQLTDIEIYEAIRNNPQKTGDQGRVMTQIRAIKDTGLLVLDGPRNKKKMKITPLGYDLMNGKNVETIYSKAMIGLHANNPQRSAMFNQSRPFLNTLFVIDGINKHYGNNKGILEYEFGAFVLSMRDCNYQKAINDIIEYRSKFGHKINQEYLENYVYNVQNDIETDFKNIISEYPDDIFRKFDMTGLVSSSGFRENKYIRFNEYNITKVESILSEYSDYKFEQFDSIDEYIKYLCDVNIPWETSDDIKIELIDSQKQILGVTLDDTLSLDTQIDILDRLHNKRVFDETIDNYNLATIQDELMLLDSRNGDSSKYKDIPEPVRLEWLIALLTAKTYGSYYVKPNLTLDDKGIPKSFATGGMADLEFITDKLHGLIEVTMMKDYQQQTNSETTSISDHLRNLDTTKDKFSLLIAPRIHNRVAEFFRFTTMNDNLLVTAMTISIYINLLQKNKTTDDFYSAIKEANKNMCSDFVSYCDMINHYSFER